MTETREQSLENTSTLPKLGRVRFAEECRAFLQTFAPTVNHIYYPGSNDHDLSEVFPRDRVTYLDITDEPISSLCERGLRAIVADAAVHNPGPVDILVTRGTDFGSECLAHLLRHVQPIGYVICAQCGYAKHVIAQHPDFTLVGVIRSPITDEDMKDGTMSKPCNVVTDKEELLPYLQFVENDEELSAALREEESAFLTSQLEDDIAHARTAARSVFEHFASSIASGALRSICVPTKKGRPDDLYVFQRRTTTTHALPSFTPPVQPGTLDLSKLDGAIAGDGSPIDLSSKQQEE